MVARNVLILLSALLAIVLPGKLISGRPIYGANFVSSALAQTLETTRTLRAGQVIGPDDVVIGTRAALPGLVTDPAEAVGMEARVTLYPGRPIPLASLSQPALVERNQLVTLVFSQGGLNIRAEGRALGRGAADDPVRVMNLASRNTVTGRVSGPATVSVP
jgi:flagellar basal body P-ring formation protein FlgA